MLKQGFNGRIAQTDLADDALQRNSKDANAFYCKAVASGMFARLMLAVGELRDGRVQQGKEILIGLSEEFPRNTLYQRQIARLH